MLDMIHDLKTDRISPQNMAGLNNLRFEGDVAFGALFNVADAIVGGPVKDVAKEGATGAVKGLGKYIRKKVRNKVMATIQDNISCQPGRRFGQQAREIIPRTRKPVEIYQSKTGQEHLGVRQTVGKGINLIFGI